MELITKVSQDKTNALTRVPSTMNACLFCGPKDIRYERIPIPEINDDELLVKIKIALTCGTDLKTYERGHPVLIKSTPSTFGHQFSGVVAKVGSSVKNFYIGQKVVAVNTAPCYKCSFCLKKRFNLCENIEFLNGAYAEYIVIPGNIVKYNTYEIPEGVSFEHAAALESLSVVLHGTDRSEIKENSTVCIIGTGSIGLLFVVLSKQVGANVISIGRNENKLKIAKELGADHTINVSNMALEAITCSPEIVIEAVGIPETWELATKIVAKGGLINFFGGCKKGTKVELDTYRLHYDELKLIGVFHHTPKYVKEALNLLSDHSFSKRVFGKIITHKLPLKDLKKAFLLHKSREAIQVAIRTEE